MKLLSIFWHSVEPDSIRPDYRDGTNPTASNFRDHIRFLRRRFTPVTVSDFVELLRNRKSCKAYRKPPVLLGFDDGFRNVITEALPILHEFQVPAVFFVLGEALNNSEFVPWFVEVKQLLRRAKNQNVVFERSTIDLTSQQDRSKLANLLMVAMSKCRSDAERDGLLTDLARLLGIGRVRATDLDDDLRLICKADLEKIAASSLLTIASHGMTHRHLASLTRAEQLEELEQSHVLLRKQCPSYYPVLAYPGGSFNADTLAVAKRIYKAAFGVAPGSYSNLYAYPRIGIEHCSTEELAYCISTTRVNYLLPLKRFLHFTGLQRIATAKSLANLRRSIMFGHS
jgi:peptidoglycan/xylan/chitin deacetylase (PgdA/CDA1 family)